jgi:hypothetical protein
MNLVVIASSNNATTAVVHVESSLFHVVDWACSLATGVTVALESIGNVPVSLSGGVTVGGHPVTRLIRAGREGAL